jgi:hypothetical protein
MIFDDHTLGFVYPRKEVRVMQYEGSGTVDFPERLKEDLVELMKMQQTVSLKPEIYGPMAWFPGEGRVGELLDKAKEIVRKYHPRTYGVSVGVPFGAQVSFTWDARS